MAPNKKTSKKTPRRRAPRTTNQNKATASNKTSVRVNVNAPAPRRRGVANKGQSTAQPRGPQFVFLPAAQPAAQPQVIQQMPMKDLFEMMREIRNPPPPTASEISDEPRRRNLLRPEDVFYHRRDAGFPDGSPMFVGGRMSDNVSPLDEDLSTTVKSTVRNPVRLETPNTFSGIQNFDWTTTKGDQMTESSMKKPDSFTPGFEFDDIATTSAFFAPINPIPKGTLLNQTDIWEKYRAEQSGRQDVVKPVSSTPVVQANVDPIEVFAVNEPMRDEKPARPKDDTQTPSLTITKPRTDYISKLRRGTIKTPKPEKLRIYGIQIMEINGIPSYYDTIKNEPIGPIID